MTITHPELTSDLQGSTLFLDTNVFSGCIRSSGLLNLLSELSSKYDCSTVSIPSVLFEFVRGSNSLEIYNQNVEFYNSIVDYTNPMKFLDQLGEFAAVMAKLNKSNKSYTDFLLAACLYQYRSHQKTYLMTTDLRAFPSFFERVHLITTEEDGSGEVRNYGIIKFNTDKYVASASSIIK